MNEDMWYHEYSVSSQHPSLNVKSDKYTSFFYDKCTRLTHYEKAT